MTDTDLMSGKDEKSDSNELQPNMKTKPSSAIWIVLITLILLVCTAFSAGYWFYVEHYQPLVVEVQEQRQNTQKIDQLFSSQLAIQAKEKENLASLAKSQTELEAVQSNLTLLQKKVSAHDRDIAQLDNTKATDWLVAEADYLSKMAGRKLWLEDDRRTSIKLLEEADRRLAEAADPSLIPVRRAIAADIQNIKQINPVSVTSVALSLSGILSTVDNLPLNSYQIASATSGEPEPVTEDIADWRENLARVWHAVMDDFVTIRRREAPVEPMMSQAQAFLAKEQLKLSLLQAQQAALHYEETLFNESLKQVNATIATHFDLSEPQISQLLGAIKNLQNTNIQRVLPPVLKSHDLLQNALLKKPSSVPKGNTI